MKLSNFRIKDRINIKSQRTDNPSNEQENNLQNQNAFKNQQINFSSFIQTFQKYMAAAFANAESNQTKKYNNLRNKKSLRLDQVDFRDRFVLIDLPEFKNQQVDYQKLENWIGELSSEILSVSFHYLTEKKMDYNHMKAFASECFLRNIVYLADSCNLTKQAIEFADKRLKQKILPYLITKYPLTNEKEVNKNLQAQVKSFDYSQVLQNDYFFSSEVVFQYRKDGRYDDLIMRLLNEIMKRCDEKKQEGYNSNFELFEKYMTEIFQTPFKPDGINTQITQNHFQKKIDEKHIGQLKQKVNESEKDRMENARQYEKYKEKVKAYTEFLIGRKISQNTPSYSEEEIQRRSMKIKSPAILRILTKWCEELWSKFENENYFWQRKEKLSLSRTKEKCLIEESVKRQLANQVKKQKNKLQQNKQKLSKINYAEQLKLLQNQLSREENIYIDREERISGLVACKLVNNLESFIIDYLNSLIHGLLRAAKNAQNNLDVFQKLIIPVPLNLLSFKISDILRCRYVSREKEVLRVFREIRKMSEQNPDMFKIIRVKNRLKLSTNDIMINIRLNNQINCEIQIAVNNAQSNFINCSNKINHYIYELQRAQFGPILQMCSIWKTCQKRAGMFVKMIEQEEPMQQNIKIQKKQQQINRNMIPCNYPFVCSQCNLHFYQNNFIVNHHCDPEENYWKCAQCLISEIIAAQNVEFFLKKDERFVQQLKNIKLVKKKVIPENGACILINRPTIQVLIFKKITHKLKDYIIILKDKEICIMKTINMNKSKQKEEFLKNFVIFEIPCQFVDTHFNRNRQKIQEQLVSQIILPNQLKNCFKESRQQISILSEKHLSKLEIQKLVNKYEQISAKILKIKSIEFSDSNLANLDLVLSDFSALNRLILNKNNIDDISRLCEFRNIEKADLSQNRIKKIPNQIQNLQHLKQLRMRQNCLEILPQGLFELKNLEILDVSYNSIKILPQNVQKLENLRMIRLGGNKFGQIPLFLFDMHKLKSINLANCGIKQVPEEIGKLIGLQYLSLKSNKLKNLPDKLFDLINLTQLFLNDNQFESLPEKLGELKNLHQLYLCDCHLKLIPESLGNLKNLNQLELSNNRLVNLPDSLGNLINLTQLNIQRNKLTALPQKIGDLQNLTKLFLYSNQIISLPENLAHLKNLNELKLNSNKLIMLPQRFGNLKNLTTLQLFSNKLTTIPEKFGDLENITKLSLYDNQLTTLPENLGDFRNLTQLILAKNQFTSLPDKMGNLKNLTSINLSHNKLTSLPEKLGDLKNLTSINLSHNKLTSLPEKLGNLKNLTSIDLSQNQFTEIPQWICMNSSITKLFISYNKIEKIPFQINQMKSLGDGNLFASGNPLKQVGDEKFVLRKFPGWASISEKLKKEEEKMKEATGETASK